MSTAAIGSAPRKMTVEEWAALDEDEPGELVDGLLVEEEMPDYVHEVVVAWLIRVLDAWAAARGAIVAGSEAKFELGPRQGRKPDVSLYLAASKKPPRRGAVRVAPDLMIEVLSPKPRDTRRDRVEKWDEYARFGVRHYWLLDPEARTFEALEIDPQGRYVRACGASSGRLLVPGFDGLTLDLDELWARIELLGDD